MADIALSATTTSNNWSLYTIDNTIINTTDLFLIPLNNNNVYDYRIELNPSPGQSINFNIWSQFDSGQNPLWNQSGGKNEPIGIFEGIIVNQSGMGFTFFPPIPTVPPFSMTIQIKQYL